MFASCARAAWRAYATALTLGQRVFSLLLALLCVRRAAPLGRSPSLSTDAHARRSVHRALKYVLAAVAMRSGFLSFGRLSSSAADKDASSPADGAVADLPPHDEDTQDLPKNRRRLPRRVRSGAAAPPPRTKRRPRFLSRAEAQPHAPALPAHTSCCTRTSRFGSC